MCSNVCVCVNISNINGNVMTILWKLLLLIVILILLMWNNIIIINVCV